MSQALRPRQSLLAKGYLPEAVLLNAVSAYPEDAAHIALSPAATDPVVIALCEHRLPAKAAEALYRRASQASTVDTIIVDGRERRDGALEVLWKRWYPGETAQMALAKSGLNQSQKEQLLRKAWVLPSVKAKLAVKVGLPERIAWLTNECATLSTPEVQRQLEGIAEALDEDDGMNFRAEPLQAVLSTHPTLVDFALASSPELVAVATTLELDEDQAHAALDRVTGADVITDFGVAVTANLLDAPATSSDVRERAWALASERWPGGLGRRGVPSPTSKLAFCTPISELTSRDDIELLLTRAASTSCFDGRPRQWLSLVDHPLLDVGLACRLSSVFDQHPVRRAMNATELVVAVSALIERFGSDSFEDHHWYHDQRSKELAEYTELQARMIDDPRTQRIFDRPHKPVEREQHPNGDLLVSTGESPWQGFADEAGDYLSAQLGDDVAAWDLVLGLCDTFGGTTAELAMTCQLASAA